MKAVTIESIAGVLKVLIDENGPSCLTEEPYHVYTEMTKSNAVDKKTAAAILHLLVSDVISDVDFTFDPKQMSKHIQRECSMNKRMADRLALIMTSLYSGDHRKEWKAKEQEGLRGFLEEEFICEWKGYAVWDADGGTVDCHYEAEIILMPDKNISEDKELSKLLKKNPFMTKEAIHDLFKKRLRKYLDHEFEDYCTCDDYYQPVVEDFGSNMEYDLEKWCKENGFEYVSFEGDGDDGGFEPKYRRGWY